jgi:hypothetical protein
MLMPSLFSLPLTPQVGIMFKKKIPPVSIKLLSRLSKLKMIRMINLKYVAGTQSIFVSATAQH